jgi:hypothetical protein
MRAERRKNGNVISLMQEEMGSIHNPKSSRINDGLSAQVSAACDRFFDDRKMRRNFSDLWRGLRGIQRKF